MTIITTTPPPPPPSTIHLPGTSSAGPLDPNLHRLLRQLPPPTETGARNHPPVVHPPTMLVDVVALATAMDEWTGRTTRNEHSAVAEEMVVVDESSGSRVWDGDDDHDSPPLATAAAVATLTTTTTTPYTTHAAIDILSASAFGAQYYSFHTPDLRADVLLSLC